MSEPLPSTNRRGFMGWMGRVGLTAIGTVAGLSATQQPAAAHGNHHACCHLAKPAGGCIGSGSGFLCPAVGIYKKTWTCCHTNGSRYGCGECQSNGSGDCWNGDNYACSEYWRIGNC
jgi:hypothetical protein